MWITNCVFQGSGANGRAIDTDTVNGGTPELYVRGAKPFIKPLSTISVAFHQLAAGRLTLPATASIPICDACPNDSPSTVNIILLRYILLRCTSQYCQCSDVDVS